MLGVGAELVSAGGWAVTVTTCGDCVMTEGEAWIVTLCGASETVVPGSVITELTVTVVGASDDLGSTVELDVGGAAGLVRVVALTVEAVLGVVSETIVVGDGFEEAGLVGISAIDVPPCT